jgi:hypothetical protein
MILLVSLYVGHQAHIQTDTHWLPDHSWLPNQSLSHRMNAVLTAVVDDFALDGAGIRVPCVR